MNLKNGKVSLSTHSDSPLLSVNHSPILIPSQISSPDAPLKYFNDLSNLAPLGKKISKLAIREVLPLLPTAGPLARESTRHIKARVDNTLFVYPSVYEKFQHR